MPRNLADQLVEFGKTIRFSHTLFALPFALGTALVAAPPWPDGWALLLLLGCMVAARTAAMGMNRVADASLDARNPRTAGRAIPAGRLSRRAALALTLASAAAFVALAWGFYAIRSNPWPGLLAAAFLTVLFGYSWTKRFTVLSHWVLGFCLGLAPVGVWIALRGRLDLVPVLIGGAVMFWTGGFDVLYALQDMEVDRREGLFSVPAMAGPERARWIAAQSHKLTLLLIAAALYAGACRSAPPVMGLGSLAAFAMIAAALAVQHVRARRASAEQVAAAFFPLNAAVSIIWLAGVAADVAINWHRGP
jgi:4-hydroxybenzoate polyprenyltransferase